MNWRTLLVGIAGAITWLALIPELQAQGRITGEGTQGFRALLAGKGLTPIESIDELNTLASEDASRVLIVSFHGASRSGQPFKDPLDDFPFSLRQFVDRGGALFVATDQQLNSTLTSDFDVSVSGHYVASKAPGFDRSFDCPYIARAPAGKPDLFQGPEGEPLRDVATNRPSCLNLQGGPPILAVFPGDTWRYEQWNRQVPLGLPLPFARGQRNTNEGRFLLLADHSIFINSMMLPRHEQNDNLRFASNCIDWLMFGSNGPRAHVIFMEDGAVWKRKDYDLSIQALPDRPEDVADYLWQHKDELWKHPEIADALASELEQSGIFQEIERADPFNAFLSRHMPPVIRILLAAGAILLGGYMLMALARSRQSVTRQGSRLATVLAQIRPRVGLLDQRVQNGIGHGLFEELARRQARQMFAELDLTPAEGAPAPRFAVEAPFWRRSQIVRDLRRVWAVAFGPQPVVMSIRDQQRWQGRLSLLKAMIHDHAIRIG